MPTPSPGSPAAAFEAALRDNPDDLAGWAAYADYLAEQGDPRGEFMRIQLALEDDRLAKADRDRLKEREASLLTAHRAGWLGDGLSAVLRPQGYYRPAEFVFRRGWVWEVGGLDVSEEAPADVLAAVAAAPELRWVQRLHVEYVFEDDSLAPLAAAAFAPGLRALHVGEGEDYTHTGCVGLADLVAACPRLADLSVSAHGTDTAALFAVPMPALRDLAVNCCHDYACGVLAGNPTLAGLRSLSFFPHMLEPGDRDPYLSAADLRALAFSPHLTGLANLAFRLSAAGDEGCDILAASGLLARLETLDLSYGTVTEAGARRLAAALAAGRPRLRTLTLTGNTVSDAGLAALRATGVAVAADTQYRVGAPDVFYHGDME